MSTLREILDEISHIVRYDVVEYLRKYTNFIEHHSRNIINLYNGSIKTFDSNSFTLLEELDLESIQIESLINLHSDELTKTVQYWEALEVFTNIRTSLDTLKNSQKWSRSSIDKNRVSNSMMTEVVLSNRQNLEQLSSSIGSTNKDSYWFKIALDNDLREEDYTIDGGNILKVVGTNKATVKLRSVLDTDIRGEKIYGRDIQRKLEFSESENDLVVLDYRDTLDQTVSILTGLGKRDTPEFESQGIQKSILSNRGSIPFPVLIRQYYEVFSRDDSFKSILIKDIRIEQDNLYIVLECETKIRETVEKVKQLV